MKCKYKGSIISFKEDIKYDTININNEKLLGDIYRIPLQYTEYYKYDNYKEYIPLENTFLYVDYIKETKIQDNIGILKYREFEGPFSKSQIIKQDIYNCLYPFLISEYYNGVSHYIQLSEIKVKYKLTCDGICTTYKNNIYIITNATQVLITGTCSNNLPVHYSFKIIEPVKNNYIITEKQVCIFPKLLIDKYIGMTDTNRKEIINMYNEMTQNKGTENLSLYKIKDKEIICEFTEKLFYKINDVLIYNINDDIHQKIEIEKGHFLIKNENVINYKELTLMLHTKDNF